MHKTKHTPTTEIHGELQQAYSLFNAKLFRNKLPNCLITLNRHSKKTRGYFKPKTFERHDESTCVDEIAMNADFFKSRTDTEILSTLVHEMAHCWQQHFGKPSRNGYHNKEWANKMDDIGLTPSTTGKEGGKRTGQSCSHYIAANGPYCEACEELLSAGFQLSWKSWVELSMPKKQTRVKFICPECDAKAWGKPSLNIECADCDQQMQAA
jgi:predicted SprT family Zn-dependent metalloprotease